MLTRPKLIVAFGVSAALVLLTFSVFSARVHAAPPATPSTPEGSQIRIARMWHGRVPEAKAAEY